ncbi:MAG: hypothetical protein U0401_01575 [Anaerolineae bacterium]
MLRKHRLFLGKAILPRPGPLREINTRLETLKMEISSKFPLTESEQLALLEKFA